MNALPIKEYLGAKTYQIDTDIYPILRGQILTLENKSFLFLDGATSIDRIYRKEQVSWFRDEQSRIRTFGPLWIL